MKENNTLNNTTAIPAKELRNVPIYNIRMMSDNEWNRLAYKNFIERQRANHATA